MGDSDWRPFVYGGVASIVAEFGTFPLDTTKTRLQVQGQKIDPKHIELRYNGMVDCFVKIFRQEGVKALYCGILPAVLRQSTYGTIKFGTYYSLKKFVAQYRADGGVNESVGLNALLAAFSGAVSSAIANPTDVLKVRMQVGQHKEDSVIRCFHHIYQSEGMRGLWRGVGPTAQRAAVIAAVELPVYDKCKKNLIPKLGDSAANHFISSFIASLGSAVASNPLDVIRTVNNEGLMALYKGFIPTWLRMGPWNIIFFITYEELKNIY